MSSLKNKMISYEVTPPVGSWKKIAAALDEAHTQDQFPSRVYNMEITPPPNAWEKIEDSLNSNTDTPVIAPVRRLSPLLRYAAAILIGVVAFGIIRLTMTSNHTIDSTARVNVSKDSSAPLINLNAAGATADKGLESGQPPKQEVVVIEKDKSTISKSSSIAKRTPRPLHTLAARRNNVMNDVSEDLSQTLYAYADHIPTLADRYVMLMTPDGNIIRMSKKWSELLCCVSGEDQDADCKDQLKKWQQKIASSELAPSPGNFMDILGLVNSLNESNGL
ncbi:hypothetical protein [Terrimonas pollutisoli]|uniref:hypothetical protein n=1 Tax=Terrimonas pollutisoli TaxID=3034147 RepID=UPI0023EAD44F|nr:hypothetical protein [Terrimonas sp. H1YJ31]